MKTKFNPPVVEINNYMPRIVALGLLAAMLLSVITGCKASAPAGSAQLDPAGVYALVSVEGKPVPCDISHEGAAMRVKSGALTIAADGTCRSESVFNVANHPDVNRVVQASWTRTGAELTMRWRGAGTTIGQISGDTFTMNNEGMIFAYRKSAH